MLSSVKAVEKRRAYEDVVVQIRAFIEDGRLKQGDQLPTERHLSETFKVSRATIREAIRTLESLKLVRSRQGEGTYVLASHEETLVQPLAAVLFSAKDAISDIFYVRKVIEPYIAELAAENAAPEEIGEMEALMSRQEESCNQGCGLQRFDADFHSLLSRMSKNSVMERLLAALVDLMEQTCNEYLQDAERVKKSFTGHHEVYIAVRDGDCTAARHAMRRHLEEVEMVVMGKNGRGGDSR
jgi:GntR family transcriptional regulator, transcriptional repressor for pyruvate dehydrogenase complex